MLCGQCPLFCSDVADRPPRCGGPESAEHREMTSLPLREPTTAADNGDPASPIRRHGMRPKALGSVFATCRAWLMRRRQRRTLGELIELDDHLLKDIGVSRQEAVRLCAKWFWQR